jgi:hypothetical protein
LRPLQARDGRRVITIILTALAVLAIEAGAMRWLKLHICDEPKEHPPRAFETESEFVDAEELALEHEARG